MAKPRGYKPIKCEHCQKEFTPTSSTARFCTPACRKLGSIRKIGEESEEPPQGYGDVINKELENKTWELVEDPAGDFRPGSLFHLVDICVDQSFQALVRECWDVGTTFRHRKTGAVYQVAPRRNLICLQK